MNARLHRFNQLPERPGSSYVLYWLRVNRRVPANHALAYAIEAANRLNLPLLCFEELSYAEPHANLRFHTFVLEGVAEMERDLHARGIGYAFHLRRNSAGPGDVLARLACKAALVVTDDYPLGDPQLDAPLAAVDSSCIVPMRLFEKREWAAYTLRPKLHRLLPDFLCPVELPEVRRRYSCPPPAWHTKVNPAAIAQLAAECDIDHSVPPSLAYSGSRADGLARLDRFLKRRLHRYTAEKNEPAAHASSGLSPYLHFGRLSSLEVALAVHEYARRHGLDAAGFLEELTVRRELAFNFVRHEPNHRSLECLPEWVRADMAEHSRDEREHVYTREQFTRAETHCSLWNATQRELLLRGTIHGYYRMYWGKKIIDWSESHTDALGTMIELHERFALDGRDPNTYSNILWCFGLHDRPWTPRPVFGKIRFMSRAGMDRKTDVKAYLREIAYLEEHQRDPFEGQAAP